MGFELVIANARIIDGSGNPWSTADIGIVAGRVARIGDLTGSPAGRVIDCAGGLVAAPGFIDIHTHSDFALLIDGLAQSKVRQGVTLKLTNHCGGWAGPLAKTSLETARRSIASYDPEFTIDWQDMAGYLERLERQGVAINSAALVGHGSVRGAVFGDEDRQPTANELKGDTKLVALLRSAAEAASDESGWAHLRAVGSSIAKQAPEFDPRNYGYSKLRELAMATKLFDIEERPHGDGHSRSIYIRDKRKKPQK